MATVLVLGTLAIVLASLESRPASAQASDCNRPMAQRIMDVAVQGVAMHPTPTRDGCWLFTGFVDRAEVQRGSGVAVLRRTGDTFEDALGRSPHAVRKQGWNAVGR